MSKISSAHPRAELLRIRERLVEGFKAGLVAPEGLAAHGRGEAFDYILSGRTTEYARRAIEAAAAGLLLAERPVISINGNVAALVPSETVELAKVIGAKLEVNLFHGSAVREAAIAEHLRMHDARDVLGIERKFSTRIPEVHSDRRKVDRRGIAAADAVLVPLEDGDRAEALKKLGKLVIAIDLNPMSRTAMAADITIVDNIVRALPLMVKMAKKLSKKPPAELHKIAEKFDNAANLRATLRFMFKRLEKLSLSDHLKPVVQVALDLADLEQALKIGKLAVEGGVEWVEAGTPLIKAVGLEAVRQLKHAFQKKTIVADMKTMDAGALEVELAAKAGADIVCVLGAAADATISEAVKAARVHDAKVLVDLLAVADPRARAKRVEQLGADYICVHVGIDQQRLGIDPLEQLQAIAGSVKVPIAVAGGITSKTAPELVKHGASIIVVGSAITKAKDVTRATRDIVEAVRRAGKIR